MEVLSNKRTCKRRGKGIAKKKTTTTQNRTITSMLKNMEQRQKENTTAAASLSPSLKIKVEDQSKENCLNLMNMMITNKKKNDKTKVVKKEFPASLQGSKVVSPMRSARIKKTQSLGTRNQAITDFYQIRRSERRCEKLIKEEKYNETIQKIINNEESGIEIKHIANKGRGIVAARKFSPNEFVMEYAGDLIDMKEAGRREVLYAADPSIGCYMYYFETRGNRFCVDATAESGRLGRLVNHSKTDPNCYTKIMWFHNELRCPKVEVPHLTIVAKRDIKVGEELTYDYGDRSKHSIQNNPWLKA